MKRRYSPGISVYLVAAFCGMAVIISVLLSEALGVLAAERVKESIGNGLADLALQTADKLDRGMFERYREVQLMAHQQDLVAPDRPRADRRAILNERQSSYRYYAWIGLADLSGKVEVATKGMLEGANVSSRPWFRNALQGTFVGDVHEAVLLAKLLPPLPSNEPKRFVDVAFPYGGKDGEAAGVLGAHLSWEWARDVEHSVMEPITARGKGVESMIVSGDNSVLLGPAALQGRKLELSSLRALEARGNGFVVEQWPDGADYLVGFARTKGFDSYPGLGWSILVRQRVDGAFGPVQAVKRQVLWTGLGLAALLSLLGLLFARRLARPLGALAQAAERMRHDEAAHISVPPGSYAEVGALATTLNTLVADLVGKKNQLNELNAHLEQRVDLRTRELEQAMARSAVHEQRIRTIVESSQDAFVAVDLDGRIMDWNSAAERLFGWRREEALERDFIALLVPERFRAQQSAALQAFRAGLADSLPQRRFERLLLNRAGEEVPVDITVGMAGLASGYFFGAFIHDITERKRVERMKDEFISTVSHELRTPMTSIHASLSMLSSGIGGELAPDIRMLVDIAERSSERLIRLLNDVLDIEKIEAGKMDYDMRPQALSELAAQALDAVRGSAQRQEVTLALEQADPLPLVRADHDRIIQVLVNLLSNAVKFSPPGGTVTLRLDSDAQQGIVSVRDQGKGIPAHFHARIFGKFAQADASDSRSKEGSGLGLNIARSIVQQHGGTLTFTSPPGEGATFTMRLPLG